MKRVVIITGASRGLGFSLAKRFLHQGDRVIGISKSRKFWKTAVKNLPSDFNFRLYQIDVTSEAEVRAFAKKIRKQFKSIDILINNAGYGGGLFRVEETSQKEFQKNIEANLAAAFYMSKYFIPYFRKQKKGLILNVSSMAGQRAVPKLFAYSAAKFGILALSQAIAKENTDINLKCLTVCPGGMNTLMRRDLFGKEDAQRQQSPDFVADVMMQIIDNKISVESGGDIVIRHGKITAIHPCPGV